MGRKSQPGQTPAPSWSLSKQTPKDSEGNPEGESRRGLASHPSACVPKPSGSWGLENSRDSKGALRLSPAPAVHHICEQAKVYSCRAPGPASAAVQPLSQPGLSPEGTTRWESSWQHISPTQGRMALYSDWLMQARVPGASEKSCLLVPGTSPHLTQTFLPPHSRRGSLSPIFCVRVFPSIHLTHPAPTQVYL